MFAYLVFGITYAFAASVQPGPFQAYIISQALNKGWRPALPAAFAPLVSEEVSRENQVTVADLSAWRDAFIKNGEAGYIWRMSC